MGIDGFIEYDAYKSMGGEKGVDEFYKVANRMPFSSDLRLARIEIVDNKLPIGTFNLTAHIVYTKLHVLFPKAEPSWKAEKTLEIISSNRHKFRF